VFKSEAVTRSAHIMIYTYQHHNVANLLDQTMQQILDKKIRKTVLLREGLPIGYLPSSRNFSHAEYADVLVKLAEVIRTDTEPLPFAENLISEFMATRLPPFGLEEFDIETATLPKKTDTVQLKNKLHLTFFERTGNESNMDEDMDEDEAEEEKDVDLDQREIVVMSSICNPRAMHMTVDARVLNPEGDAFAIPIEYKPILEKLMKSEEPVSLDSLQAKNALGKDIDTMVLIRGLFNMGALEVVSK